MDGVCLFVSKDILVVILLSTLSILVYYHSPHIQMQLLCVRLCVVASFPQLPEIMQCKENKRVDRLYEPNGRKEGHTQSARPSSQ